MHNDTKWRLVIVWNLNLLLTSDKTTECLLYIPVSSEQGNL